jgi:hypothetical protein
MIDPTALRPNPLDHLPRRRFAIVIAALLLPALLALGPPPATAGLFDIPCNPGTASRTGKQPCSACPAGSFASESGATSCEACPIGTFAAQSGSAMCQACASGTYADEEGSAICVRDQVSWPSEAAQCENPNDLEICIVQGIRDGGIVEIAVDDVPAQEVTVTGKGFTLRPQPGRVPSFGAGTTIIARGSEADVEVVIEGLVIEMGRIDASQNGPHRFEATIRGNEIQRLSGIGAIEVNSGLPSNAGPTLFRVEDNRITIDRSDTFASDISAITASFSAPGTANELVIRGNAIEQRNTGQTGAIEIFSSGNTLALDVIGNRIDGADYNNGVKIIQSAGAATTGLVANNAVSGQVSSAGVTGAIGVRLDGDSADLAIVNNSLAFNEAGFRVDGSSDSIDVSFANNVVAFNDLGVIIQADGVANVSNLVFGNGFDFLTLGPGTIAADPLFAPADDLSLSAASPARDAGSSVHVPLDLTLDLAGNPRIVGPSVDIGAFEVPEPATGLAVAALAALAALRRRARRRDRALLRMACAVLPALALASGAGAAGVVGNGTPESCTGSAFANALVGGGLVTFDCGAAPKTIVVDTALITNGTTTTVDGGGLVRLDGDSQRQLFFVLAGGDLTVRNISLTNGNTGAGRYLVRRSARVRSGKGALRRTIRS